MTATLEQMEEAFQASLARGVVEIPNDYRRCGTLPPPTLLVIHPLLGMRPVPIPDYMFDNKDHLCVAIRKTLKMTGCVGYMLVMQGWLSKPDRIIGRLEDQPAPSKDPMRTECIMLIARSPLGNKRHLTYECDDGKVELVIDTNTKGHTVQALTPFADLLDP